MKRKGFAVLGILVFTICSITGCEKKLSIELEAPATSTPIPTATPTPGPTPTPTPVPTATPAPRMIGKKAEGSRGILLTNNLNTDLRQIYVRTSGSEEWNKNLISSESTVRAAETITMYYVSPADMPDATFDLKIYTKSGEIYELYGVNLKDMDSARLAINDYGDIKLSYKSLSTNEETVAENSWGYNDDWDYDYDYDSSYDYDYNYDYDDSYGYDDSYDYDYDYGYDDSYDYDYDYGYDDSYDYDYDYDYN